MEQTVAVGFRKGNACPVRDVVNPFSIRIECSRMAGLSLDVKAAHKRVVIRDEEQGLLGFYRVAPFGATFAQHWWGRTGSCILSILHALIWIAHCGYLFVDDCLFFQLASILPITGSMICLFFQICSIPLSWKKLQIGAEVGWIGWRLLQGLFFYFPPRE